MSKERIKLSEIEIKCFSALQDVTFLPGSFDKRFARSIIGATESGHSLLKHHKLELENTLILKKV